MRLAVENDPLRRILKWIRRLLVSASVLLLGYCGLAVADAWWFQHRASQDLDSLLQDRGVVNKPAPAGDSAIPAPDVAATGLIGRIEIPRLSLSVVVFEGVDKTTLRRAVGHVPGTALPGMPGNVVLAAHRDTFFRPLKDLKVNDEVLLSTLRGNFTYKVESLQIVEPGNAEVGAQSDANVLTLVTCYPFYYVGPAPKRWIVRAKQVLR